MRRSGGTRAAEGRSVRKLQVTTHEAIVDPKDVRLADHSESELLVQRDVPVDIRFEIGKRTMAG